MIKRLRVLEKTIKKAETESELDFEIIWKIAEWLLNAKNDTVIECLVSRSLYYTGIDHRSVHSALFLSFPCDQYKQDVQVDIAARCVQ